MSMSGCVTCSGSDVTCSRSQQSCFYASICSHAVKRRGSTLVNTSSECHTWSTDKYGRPGRLIIRSRCECGTTTNTSRSSYHTHGRTHQRGQDSQWIRHRHARDIYTTRRYSGTPSTYTLHFHSINKQNHYKRCV